jgi:hypothetical protein
MATIKNRKETTQTVTIPNGTGATIQDFRFPLDRDYSHVTEMYVIERSNGGNAQNYRIGFRNEEGLIVRELAPKEAYLSQTNIPIHERYVPIELEANGRNVIVKVETFAATSADLVFDVIYVMVNH